MKNIICDAIGAFGVMLLVFMPSVTADCEQRNSGETISALHSENSIVCEVEEEVTTSLQPDELEPLVTIAETSSTTLVTTISTTTTTVTTIEEKIENEKEEIKDDSEVEDVYVEDHEEEDYDGYVEEDNDTYEMNNDVSYETNVSHSASNDVSDYEYSLLVNLTSSEYGAVWVPTEEKSKIAATVLNIADEYYDGDIEEAIYNSCVPYGFNPSYDYYKDDSIYNAVDDVIDGGWEDWGATGWYGDGTNNYFS